MKVYQWPYVVAIALVFAVLFFGVSLVEKDQQKEVPLGGNDVATTTEITPTSSDAHVFLIPLERYFEDEINSRAVYVEYRDGTGVYELYGRKENKAMPLASLTKTMTAVTALSFSDMVETVAVGEDAIAQEGDQGLLKDMRWPLEDAVSFMMQSSSNDMAYAIQESVSQQLSFASDDEPAIVNLFVRGMNDRAQAMGLEDTFYVDAIGFDQSERLSGSYGSAKDVATLAWYTIDLYPEIAAASIKSNDEYRIGGLQVVSENTNPTLQEYDSVVFSKTGFTDLAGGNLALVARVGQGSAAIVIMGSTFEGRFRDARIVLDGLARWEEYNF